MIIPPKLQSGDTIAITATARKIDFEALEPCIQILKDWGLEVDLSPGLMESEDQFAGSDAVRLQSLQTLLDRKDVGAILFARGGYGTTRILDQIDFSAFRENPKWLIGFSDLTPLINYATTQGIMAIHGPMGISFSGKTANEESIEYLRHILMLEGWPTYTWKPNQEDLLRTGMAKGKVLGGNLSLFAHNTGSKTEMDLTGSLLFLEDLDEYLYHIDRMVVQLKRSGKLDSIAGLMIGGMTDMNDNDTPFGKSPEEILAYWTKDQAYPLVTDLPVGHQEMNFPLILGMEATLSVSHATASLKFEGK